MKIGLTGATGFLGRHFIAAARNAGHDIIGYSRTAHPRPEFTEVRAWLPIRNADFSGIDALVHLAGEPIFGLWTAGKKEAIRHSRVNDTCDMVDQLREQCPALRCLVSAGGIAYYGDCRDEELTEASPPGESFLAEVSRAWEDAGKGASDFTRVVSFRMGMILGGDGGAAVFLRRIFRAGLGGRLGHGRQWFPWIHVEDMARLILFAVTHESIKGPVNGVAPGLVRNAEFTRTLAASLHRPTMLSTPSFILKLLPGGMGEMFLHSQRAHPEVAQSAGFSWLYQNLPTAWHDIISSSAS